MDSSTIHDINSSDLNEKKEELNLSEPTNDKISNINGDEVGGISGGDRGDEGVQEGVAISEGYEDEEVKNQSDSENEEREDVIIHASRINNNTRRTPLKTGLRGISAYGRTPQTIGKDQVGGVGSATNEYNREISSNDEELNKLRFQRHVTAFDVDINSLDEHPWRMRNVDILDYFNYGFNERTWTIYCEKQLKLRAEKGLGPHNLRDSVPAAKEPLPASLTAINVSISISTTEKQFETPQSDLLAPSSQGFAQKQSIVSAPTKQIATKPTMTQAAPVSATSDPSNKPEGFVQAPPPPMVNPVAPMNHLPPQMPFYPPHSQSMPMPMHPMGAMPFHGMPPNQGNFFPPPPNMPVGPRGHLPPQQAHQSHHYSEAPVSMGNRGDWKDRDRSRSPMRKERRGDSRDRDSFKAGSGGRHKDYSRERDSRDRDDRDRKRYRN